MNIKPDYVSDDGSVTLYRGDCMDVLPHLSGVDAVVTDPPYGVGLGQKPNAQRFDRVEYDSFTDDVLHIDRVCVPVIRACFKMFGRVVMTPGVRNMYRYDAPTHTGSFFYPAASGCNSWGFSCWQPVFFYGKDPYAGRGSRPDSFKSTESAERNGHPCPKPIGQTVWMVERGSLSGQAIMDPFMGSGTTGVACVKLGRKFIGIELSRDYFDIAVKRIKSAYADGGLFNGKMHGEEQMGLGL